MKRCLKSLVVFLVVFLLSFSLNAFGSPFSDVDSTDWYYPYVEAIYNAGITKGYPDGTYRPFNLVTRAQMATFIARALKLDNQTYCDNSPFSDVNLYSWYCPAVEVLKKHGIVKGLGNGKFNPKGYVTRAQAAVMIARALNLKVTPCTTSPFSDVSATDWYCPYVKALSDRGIIEGEPDGRYLPTEAVTRGEMAVYIARAFLGMASGGNGSGTNGNGNNGSGSSSNGGMGGSGNSNGSENGQKLNLGNMQLNNGYGTCTENSFKWSGSIVVSQMDNASYVECANSLNSSFKGNLFYDPYTDNVYCLTCKFNNSQSYLEDNTCKEIYAYKIKLQNHNYSETELSWLENVLRNTFSDHDQFFIASGESDSGYIRNNLIFILNVFNDSSTLVALNKLLYYDFNIANKTVDTATLNNYYQLYDSAYHWSFSTIGTDNSCSFGIAALQKVDDNGNYIENAFIYLNPNNVSPGGIDINTEDTFYLSNFFNTYSPVIANGNIYLAGVDSDNNSIIKIIDLATGQLIKNITIADIFSVDNGTTIKNDESFFNFRQPKATYDGKYVFAPFELQIPDPDNTKTKLKFYFIAKINTSTNNIDGFYGIDMIKGWDFGDFAVSPHGKYIYADMYNGFNFNFMELLVINTENRNERAYKLYINQKEEGKMTPYSTIVYDPGASYMSTNTKGSRLYIPIVIVENNMHNTRQISYALEIPTAELNSSVQ